MGNTFDQRVVDRRTLPTHTKDCLLIGIEIWPSSWRWCASALEARARASLQALAMHPGVVRQYSSRVAFSCVQACNLRQPSHFCIGMVHGHVAPRFLNDTARTLRRRDRFEGRWALT